MCVSVSVSVCVCACAMLRRTQNYTGAVYPVLQNEHQHEGVEMGSESELKWVSQLLQLSEDWCRQALTMKVTVSPTCS